MRVASDVGNVFIYVIDSFSSVQEAKGISVGLGTELHCAIIWKYKEHVYKQWVKPIVNIMI